MKTTGKENPNRCTIIRQRTELLGRKLEPSLLSKTTTSRAEVFFPDLKFAQSLRLRWPEVVQANQRAFRGAVWEIFEFRRRRVLHSRTTACHLLIYAHIVEVEARHESWSGKWTVS
jgi:hypothetical protein